MPQKSVDKLTEILHSVVPSETFAERRIMFGYPCCFANGNMFAGIHRKSLVIRLSEEDRREFMKSYRARNFKPFTDGRLRDYVVVPKTLLSKKKELSGWMDRAFTHALTLSKR